MNSERARELATKALQMSAACKEFADQLDNARRHVEPYQPIPPWTIVSMGIGVVGWALFLSSLWVK